MPVRNQPSLNVSRPFYFPLESGRYEVKPGLAKFPHDFGNGAIDRQLFQIDDLFKYYRQEKLSARRENLAKYYCIDGLTETEAFHTCRFLVNTLVEEHPALYSFASQSKATTLDCRLSGETLSFDPDFRLRASNGPTPLCPSYTDGLDALACQVQEDLAIVRIDRHEDKLVALHLCLPNHWAADEKIGHSFISAHAAVPGMEKINQNVQPLLQAILDRGPFVRFAWGIATDTRLNCYPHTALQRGLDPSPSRKFDPDDPSLYLRVERQVLHRIPDTQCILFTIRTYFYDTVTIATEPTHIPSLIAAINSMTARQLEYKGLLQDKPAIVQWLKHYPVA